MDFSSITKILRENEVNEKMSNSQYYFTLFDYAFEQENIKISIPADAEISKIMNGKRNVPKDIIFLYQTAENILLLEKSVNELLTNSSDPEYVREHIYRLLSDDPTISESKKQELSFHYSFRDKFITECLLFGMSRGFVKSDIGKSSVATFILSDYLLDSRIPTGSKVFHGREREISEISVLLKNSGCLFLEGIGGIGKSELAKHFIKQYQKEYTHVVYLTYNGSLKRTIAGLDFIDDTLEMSEEERFRNHYRLFKRLDNTCLVVLDNFNTIPAEDELFYDFLSMGFQLLATTRSHIEDVRSLYIHEIENMDALQAIFCAYAPQGKNYLPVVTEIIDEVYRHTLTVELAAKTLTASGMKPEQLLNVLKQEGLKLSDPNKITVKKDEVAKKERMYQHILTLFRLQELSTENIHVLRNMTLMPEKGIAKILFQYWQGQGDCNTTNELIEYGWIDEDNELNYISLHRYLREVLILETKPSITTCADLLKGIFENCVCYGLDVPYYNELLNTIENIYRTITLDDVDSATLFMDTTMAYLSKYERLEAIEKVLALMWELIEQEADNRRLKGIYYCYAGYVYYMKSSYQTAKKSYQKGLRILEPFNSVYAELVSNLYNNLGQACLALGDMVAFKENIEQAIKIREAYHLPISHDTIVQGISYAQALAVTGERELARKKLFALIRMVRKIEGMGMTLSDLYSTLASIEGNRWLEESHYHYKKAKAALLEANIPVSDPNIKELEKKIRQTEALTSGLASGKVHRIGQNN